MGSNAAGSSHRAGFLAGGTLAGVVVAGILRNWGASGLQALGMGLFVVGIALWVGSMRPDPATLAIDERTRRQRHRSRAIALGLAALVAIFYVATLVRLGPNALRKDGFADVNAAKKNVILEDRDGGIAPRTIEACKKAGTC